MGTLKEEFLVCDRKFRSGHCIKIRRTSFSLAPRRKNSSELFYRGDTLSEKDERCQCQLLWHLLSDGGIYTIDLSCPLPHRQKTSPSAFTSTLGSESSGYFLRSLITNLSFSNFINHEVRVFRARNKIGYPGLVDKDWDRKGCLFFCEGLAGNVFRNRSDCLPHQNSSTPNSSENLSISLTCRTNFIFVSWFTFTTHSFRGDL